MSDLKLDDILDALAIPVIAVANDERILAMNAAAIALIGPGVIGRHYVAVIRQPALIASIENTLKNGKTGEADYIAPHTTGEGNYRARTKAVDLDDGPGVIVSFEDKSKVRQIDEMRRDFVANVSHELRTPLTALLGFIETLRGAARDDPEAQERFLTTMLAEAERMNRLIGDLLSLSRVESDERIRPTGQVDIVEVVRLASRSLEPLAGSNKVTVNIIANVDPVFVIGDSDQLIQVFTNLLENSIKYGANPGQVTISFEPSEMDPTLRVAAVRVELCDQGEGIKPIHIPRLTERFYRVDSHRSREMGGTGLGLAIVKHIINRHRGRFRVASVPGSGSTFSVVLPTP